MGFLTNTTTIELIAKLTPQGRAKLVSNTNTLITSFSLGDSDAYYSSYTGLTGGQVPQISGDNAGLDINNGGVNSFTNTTCYATSCEIMNFPRISLWSIINIINYLIYNLKVSG